MTETRAQRAASERPARGLTPTDFRPPILEARSRRSGLLLHPGSSGRAGSRGRADGRLLVAEIFGPTFQGEGPSAPQNGGRNIVTNRGGTPSSLEQRVHIGRNQDVRGSLTTTASCASSSRPSHSRSSS